MCREATTTVVDTSVYIVSPNVYQTEVNGRSPSPWPVCECIVNSRYTDQIMADYIHSDVYASGDRCSDNYVLVESKMFPNQTTVDKEVEVCGRRTVSNQMFRGSVRLTYYNNRRSTDDGFLTKFRGTYLFVLVYIFLRSDNSKSWMMTNFNFLVKYLLKITSICWKFFYKWISKIRSSF